MLHVESTSKGVLFPRMSTVQRTAIVAVNGLIVFDTDSSTLYIYQVPSGWKQLKALASFVTRVGEPGACVENVGEIHRFQISREPSSFKPEAPAKCRSEKASRALLA